MAIGHHRNFPTLLLIPAGTTLRFPKLPPPKTLNLSITHDMQQKPKGMAHHLFENFPRECVYYDITS
jgi:hypothetical protein